MYAKVTKLIIWKLFYKWQLHRINRLQALPHPKISQAAYSSYSFCIFRVS